MPTGFYKRRPLLERFYDKVMPEPNTGCWIWTAASTVWGYGVISVNGKITGAHRASYTIHKGEISDGLYVCHTCDNKWCVNPDHLFAATQSDNMLNMYSKGYKNIPRGEDFAHSKLTDSQIVQIRNLSKNGMSGYKIGKLFNVSRTLIYSVLDGKLWKHIK